MNNTTGFKTILALILSAGWSAVFAASVSLTPSVLTVGTGDSFSVDLVLDASDINNPDYSGQVLISYDPLFLTYDSFTDMVGGTVITTVDNTVLVNFGDISDNTATIGAVFFTSNSLTGNTQIDATDGNNLYSLIANQDEFFPTYNPSIITVVPLPGALWLMLSGLGLLGLARRRV